jgi:GTP-binding protein HflX
VGFVRKFPHHLAESFHATLEEAGEADLLLHVVDASKPDIGPEVAAVNSVLADIGCLEKPTIYALNKVDLAGNPEEAALLAGVEGDLIMLSARTGAGLDALDRRVGQLLGTGRAEFHVTADVGNGRLIAFLHEHGDVRDERFTEGTAELTVRMDPASAGVIQQLGGRVTTES